MLLELSDGPPLLKLVDLDDRGEELEVIARVPGQLLEGLDVFGKTRAAEADARPEESRADAIVEAHAAGDLGDVGTELFRHVRDFVDEADLGREECVRGELDHLGGRHVGADQRGLERRVDRFDSVSETRRVAVRPDHDPIGFHEVVYRAALLEELRVRDVANAVAAPLDRASRSDRNGALHHQRMIVRVAQLGDHGLDAGEVGVAGVGRRSVDRDEQKARVLEHGSHLGREVQARSVLRDQLRQAGLVDGHFAA